MSINVVVDDARTSYCFSDDKECMTFSPSEQEMDKNLESPSEPKPETKKKLKTSANEEIADPKTSSSKTIVPDIIRQFEEKSA